MTSRALPKSLLLADDEQGFRDLFHFVLAPMGYEVVTVADGQTAVELVATRSFDVVILDAHMPRLNGPEAVAQIRELRPNQRILIFSGSSEGNRTFEEQVQNEAGIECVYKPLSLDELVRAIERAFGDRRGGDS